MSDLTTKAIKEAFFELLSKKSIDQITIAAYPATPSTTTIPTSPHCWKRSSWVKSIC